MHQGEHRPGGAFPDTYKTYSDLFEEDLYTAIDLVTCVETRISVGGPSVADVEAQIQYVKEVIA